MVKLQHDILCFISCWVHENKNPISRSDIILEMLDRGIKDFTVINALNSLQKKGYIRRSTLRSNKTSYIMLRSI